MKKLPITVIILTRDEEIHLERCLENIVPHAERVHVVDWGSVDKTREIAKRFGAVITEHEFVHQADQFNWALDHLLIETPWILRLDADEYCTAELWKEIGESIGAAPEGTSGFYIKRRVYFMGRWIRHGGYYPSWFLRLFRKGMARYEEREMDEHLLLESGGAGFLKNDFVDWNLKGLADWTAKHNGYSTREVAARLREESEGFTASGSEGQAARKKWMKHNIYGRLPLFIRPFIYFVYRYVFRLGFLDGVPGFAFHVLQGFWHQFLIDVKLHEAKYIANEKKEKASNK
ncbi:MAG: glycosyltransferase family 2 protein [Patescibacteria group bacterium]